MGTPHFGTRASENRPANKKNRGAGNNLRCANGRRSRVGRTCLPFSTFYRNGPIGELRNRGDHERRTPGQSLYRANKNQDRKSTRLNSSHVAISYAVFCLKKKKKIQVLEGIEQKNRTY